MKAMQHCYREDVDGLRAIAVILVILAHFKAPFFEGGFIGVDVFFVISGFVISKLILTQRSNETFSLTSFYIKRVKRLAPALLVMVYLTLIVFGFILSPLDLIKSIEGSLWISAYLANFFHWLNYGGYFSESASSAPFLHTWSLAIEEQFYLLWPLLFLALHREGSHKLLLVVVSLFVAISAFVSELSLNFTFGASYYLLPTRAFELGIGCIVGIVGPRVLRNRLLADFVSLGSLTGLFVFAVVYDETTRFPGLNALYVCILTAIFISQYNNKSLGYRLLCLPIFQSIGKMSYSIYLWHWPVITWVNYRYENVGLYLVSTATVLTLLLGYLSWRFVENSVRHNKKISNTLSISLFIIAPLIFSIALYQLSIISNGFPQRFSERVEILESSRVIKSNELRGKCHSALKSYNSLPREDCLIGDKDGEKRGLLIGDSHANHLVGFIDVLGKKANISTTDYTLDQCVPLFGLQWGTSYSRAQACKMRNELAEEYIIEHKPDVVYMGGSWPNFGSESILIDGVIIDDVDTKYQYFKQKLHDTLNSILQHSSKVVLFKDTAFYSQIKPSCPIKKAMYSLSTTCEIPYLENEMMADIFNEISAKFSTQELEIIDTKEFYCNGEFCNLAIENTLVYIDEDHITYEASKLFGTLYLKSNSR
ncbi:acetyltransferase [Alteromonas naphthalenivorans]|uniref:Acetyltransferase n=2 Tax=Alteromonas naphthalenivorans TaxID=715451 RepID=F5ZC35_ALTNA|nr:acetyltransferase [Alteromonas naphthalenivorans]